MKISLPRELKRRVQQRVDGGLYEDAGDVIRAALRAFPDEDISRVINRAGLSGMDVSEAAFMVLALATKDMDDDIRLIMAEIKGMTAAKAKLRARIQDLNGWISEEMGKHESSPGIANEPIHSEAQRPMPYRPGGQVAEILTSVMDGLQEDLDGMNELSEMTSLRLQMLMDRRSKLIETLSNILKKIATTQDSLVQNLK
jgi:Arc/MetJ-type ribon-helix-helix transcriptional regulator